MNCVGPKRSKVLNIGEFSASKIGQYRKWRTYYRIRGSTTWIDPKYFESLHSPKLISSGPQKVKRSKKIMMRVDETRNEHQFDLISSLLLPHNFPLVQLIPMSTVLVARLFVRQVAALVGHC